MKLQVKKGTTSKIVEVFILDSSATDGSGLTGLVYNTASLTAYYTLNGAAGAATVHTLATMTIGTWASGGFVEKDATNMPGVYQLGVFDAALTGADSSVIMLKGAANMAPVVLEIELVDYDPFDSVRMGLTALPNAAADAAGGLPISDAGGLDLDATDANVSSILTDTGTTIPATISTAQADLDTITGTDGVTLATTQANYAPAKATDIVSSGAITTSGGVASANAVQLSGSATAADNLEASALGIVSGVMTGTPSTTSIAASALPATVDDTYNGRVIVITSGDAAGEATEIIDYTGSSRTLTVTALASTPAASDTFVIV